MSYRQASAFVNQFLDANGQPLSGGTLKSYLAGTTTTTAMFTDGSGTSAGSTITLNARGEPEVSGNTINIWLDETITYKLVLADSAGATIWIAHNVNVGIAAEAANILTQGLNSLGDQGALQILVGAVETLDTSGALQTLSDALIALTITGGLQNALDAKLNIGDNAVSASKWATPRTLTLGGHASGSVSIDGTGNIILNASVSDSDKLDGYHASTTRNAANTVPVRDSNGYLDLGWINTTSGSTTSTINKIYASSDDYIRFITPDTLKSQLGLWHTGNDGSGSGLDADKLDGLHASSFLRSDTADTASGKITMTTGIARSAHNVGHLEGGYNNISPNDTQSNPIYTLGSNYNPGTTTLGNMYGIGYTHSNASFIPQNMGWGMYVATDGDARVMLSGESGHGFFTGNVTAYASDERLKTNIKPIENALDKVSKIRGVTYDWVDDIKSEYDFHPSTMHETGVIAQEIKEVIPDAVSEAPMNGNYTAKCGKDHEFLTVQKDKIIPLLIEAIKELKAEVDELKGGRQ